MSNYINSNGSFQFNVSGQLVAANMVLNQVGLTGGNLICNIVNVPIGATPTTLVTSSLTSTRYTYFANESTGSVVYISQTSVPSGVICAMQPGDFAIFPNTGSGATQYYAFASSSTALLEYVMCEY